MKNIFLKWKEYFFINCYINQQIKPVYHRRIKHFNVFLFFLPLYMLHSQQTEASALSFLLFFKATQINKTGQKNSASEKPTVHFLPWIYRRCVTLWRTSKFLTMAPFDTKQHFEEKKRRDINQRKEFSFGEWQHVCKRAALCSQSSAVSSWSPGSTRPDLIIFTWLHFGLPSSSSYRIFILGYLIKLNIS